MARILSGVQPSGKLHLGNYFGALKQQIDLQQGNECYYFIANLHSLTSIKDPETLRANTQDIATAYLALGLDPHKATLYRQSDVPEITEIALLLSMVIGMGELERCHAYKDKTERGIMPSVGLFYYPILMAADILSMQADVIPVGGDQKQHLELTRNIAVHFNATYGEVFKLPKAKYSPTPKVYGTRYTKNKVPLKMSKSYGNTIETFATEKQLKKVVMGIETDTFPMEAELSTENCLVFSLYKLLACENEQLEMQEKYKRKDYGFGHAKKELLAKILAYFADARQKKAELETNSDLVEEVLRNGAKKARVIAAETLEKVRAACGVL